LHGLFEIRLAISAHEIEHFYSILLAEIEDLIASFRFNTICRNGGSRGVGEIGLFDTETLLQRASTKFPVAQSLDDGDASRWAGLKDAACTPATGSALH